MSPSQKFTTRALGLMFLVTIAACGDDEVDTGPPITLVEEENNATTPDNSSANATARDLSWSRSRICTFSGAPPAAPRASTRPTATSASRSGPACWTAAATAASAGPG